MKQILTLLSLVIALNLSAQDFDQMLNKANGYFFKKDYQTAINEYQNILKANVGDSLQRSWAYGYIGSCSEGLGNTKKAITNYLKSIELGSPYALFYKNLLKIYKNQKDYKGQEFVLINLQKNLPYEYRNAAKKLAYVYLKSKQYKKMLATCNELTSWYPNKFKFVYLKAVAYHQLKQFDDAIATYKKGIELNAADLNCNKNLGMLLFIIGNKQFDNAVEKYNAIAKPTDADYKKCKKKLANARPKMMLSEPYLLKAYKIKASNKLKKTLHTLYIKCNKKEKAELYKS